MTDEILNRAREGAPLNKRDAIALLSIGNLSPGFYALLAAANAASRERYRNRGYIFAQIGVNSAPCNGNCRFCSFARDSFSVDAQYEKSAAQVLSEARAVAAEGIDALFLMTTADFDQDEFIRIGQAVRYILPQGVQLIANVGDFNAGYAARLRAAGFSGAYHIVRLREGTDTDISPQTRVATLDAIKSAGLELFYCVEPIGREHTYDEIAEEMLRARDYGVDVMAVMARVGVRGTRYEGAEPISELELTKIAAVARLVTDPKKSMNVHEPRQTPLLAGVNQLYAEYGANPRDTSAQTSQSRGFDTARVRAMLRGAEWEI